MALPILLNVLVLPSMRSLEFRSTAILSLILLSLMVVLLLDQGLIGNYGKNLNF